MTGFFPAIFVILWSTPFITLSLRFALVFICFAAFTALKREFQKLPARAIGEAALTGILFHGMYLGGVFYAQANGMSAGMSALIVSLHPRSFAWRKIGLERLVWSLSWADWCFARAL